MVISCKWWHEFSGVCCNPDSEYRNMEDLTTTQSGEMDL